MSTSSASNNYLKLKESSGVDIPGEIEKEVEKLKISETVTGILKPFGNLIAICTPRAIMTSMKLPAISTLLISVPTILQKQPIGKNAASVRSR